MRTYIRIKNLLLASFVAGIYKTQIVAGTSVISAIVACLAIGFGVFYILDAADEVYIRWYREKRRREKEEKRARDMAQEGEVA